MGARHVASLVLVILSSVGSAATLGERFDDQLKQFSPSNPELIARRAGDQAALEQSFAEVKREIKLRLKDAALKEGVEIRDSADEETGAQFRFHTLSARFSRGFVFGEVFFPKNSEICSLRMMAFIHQPSRLEQILHHGTGRYGYDLFRRTQLRCVPNRD